MKRKTILPLILITMTTLFFISTAAAKSTGTSLRKIVPAKTMSPEKIKKLWNIHRLRREISWYKENEFVSKSGLTEVLENNDSRLEKIENQILSTDDEIEIEMLSLSGVTDEPEQLLVYIDKIASINNTANKLTDIQNKINKLVERNRWLRFFLRYLGLDSTVKNIDDLLENISDAVDAGSIDDLSGAIDDLRTSVVYTFGKYRSAAIRYKSLRNSSVFRLADSIIKAARYDLPYLPDSLSGDIGIHSGTRSKTEKELEVVVCLMRWDDTYPKYREDELLDATDDADLFFLENSYGKIKLNFTIIANDEVWNGEAPDNNNAEVLATIDHCGKNADINFNDYDIGVVFPSLNRESGGIALTGAHQYSTRDGSSIDTNFILIADYNIRDERSHLGFSSVLKHELGHWMGAPMMPRHANFLDCGDIAFSDKENMCEHIEYGNMFDTMGFVRPEGHFSGSLKERIGWIKGMNLRENKSRVYRLFPLELKSDGTQVIRIAYKNNPLSIEYRIPEGRDDFIETSKKYDFAGGKNWKRLIEDMAMPVEGVLFINISEYDPDRNSPRPRVNLIDTMPNSDDNDINERLDSYVIAHKTFWDPALGIEVSFVPKYSNEYNMPYAEVHLTFDESREFEDIGEW